MDNFLKAELRSRVTICETLDIQPGFRPTLENPNTIMPFGCPLCQNLGQLAMVGRFQNWANGALGVVRRATLRVQYPEIKKKF